MPTSTKIAIAAAPGIFIAHAFAPIEITGDETRSFQYAYAEPLKKAARARHGASVYQRASIGLSLAGRFARWVKHPGGTAALLEQQRIRRIPAPIEARLVRAVRKQLSSVRPP